MAFIYSIYNTITQKRYIGETLCLDDRWQRHLWDLQHNKHHSHKLQASFNKYGVDAFVFTTLEEVDDDIRFSKEKQYIAQYNSYLDGYNETSGGDNPGFEQLQKTVYCYDFDGYYLNECYVSGRAASRELNIDQALLQKICIGTKISAYDKNNRRLRFSYQLVDKLPAVKIINGRSVSINQYDLNHNYIQTFDSYRAVNRYFGITEKSSKINLAVKNHKPYKGFLWEINI